MKFPLCYEATISRAEFLRTLPAATDEGDFREVDGRFEGRGWSIRLTPIVPFGVGMVRLISRIKVGAGATALIEFAPRRVSPH